MEETEKGRDFKMLFIVGRGTLRGETWRGGKTHRRDQVGQ